MCGIAGIFDFRGHRDVDRVLVHRMTEIIAHRGPDGDGFHIAPGIGLGMRRLAIVDLVTGDQPQFNEDGTVCVVYNGEIYNFQPLMAELAALGHDFRTRSDTEAIIHAFEEYGDNFERQLTGMFGFALWDERRRMLVLSRDRIGIKPLYYAVHGNRLIFASEIKAILAVPMLVKDKLIGVMEAINRADGSPFNDQDVQMLETFAAQAAIAIATQRVA